MANTADQGEHWPSAEKVLETAPGLLGVLLPIGDARFLRHASAYIEGCPERYEYDPVETPDMSEDQKTVYALNQTILRAVDAAQGLLAAPEIVVTSLDAAEVSRRQKVGIWNSEAIPPWEWRRQKRAQ